jgi:hypothetical protein
MLGLRPNHAGASVRLAAFGAVRVWTLTRASHWTDTGEQKGNLTNGVLPPCDKCAGLSILVTILHPVGKPLVHLIECTKCGSTAMDEVIGNQLHRI